MKKSTIIGLFCSTLYFGVQAQDASDKETIYFEKNSYELTDQAKENLQELKTHIKKTRNRKEIKITGHTDVDASNGYNKKLALNRALAVQQFLESEQVYNRCHLFSKGEEQTVNANSSEIEKALNRRVEIALNYTNDNSVYKSLRKKYQQYEVTLDKDTVLICKEGSQLVINKGVFDVDPRKGPVKVKVKEFYDKGSFIASNITASTYDNKILESRGMLNISASQKGKPVKLKHGEEIKVLFKDRVAGDGTELFKGVRNNGEMVWKQANSGKDWGSSGSWTKRTTTYADGEIVKQVSWYETLDAGVRKTYKVIKMADQVIVDSTGQTDTEYMGDIRSTLMAVSDLGWINCDRFYKNTSPKINYIVRVPGELNPDVTLVFEDINSVMPYTYRIGNDFVFANIPTGMKVKVIGLYRKGLEKDYYLASTSGITSSNKMPRLILKKGTKEDVKNLMAGL